MSIFCKVYDHADKRFCRDFWSTQQDACATFSSEAIEKALHIMNTQKWYERFIK